MNKRIYRNTPPVYEQRKQFLTFTNCPGLRRGEATDNFKGDQYWKPGEHLWAGMLPKHTIGFYDSDFIHHEIRRFFNSKAHTQVIPEDYLWDTGKNIALEKFPKMCWLTNVLVNHGQFDNPVCVHWNPRHATNVIHPGSIRGMILKLFHSGPINSIYFNTGGFYTTWMKDLNPVEIDDVLDDHKCAFIADHGSLIPHLYKDTNIIPDNIQEWYYKVSNKLNNKDFKIFIDVMNYEGRLSFLEQWTTSDPNQASVTIKFNNYPPNMFDICVAIITAFSEVDYSNKNVCIKQINS